jgi:hypothetical protein
MRVLFAGQVPKDPTYSEANEDRLELSVESGRIAVSDGASESFDSQTWAGLLVKKFVHDPALGKGWLAELVSEYAKKFDVNSLSWSKQAAFERGSFATLLGIENYPLHGTIDVLSVGDSLAILLDQNELIGSYPYSSSVEFQQRPELFSTSPAHNSFFDSPDFFTLHHQTWNISDKKNPVLLCMTDALGEWALRLAQEGNPQWRLLAAMKDVSLLQSLVLEERAHKRMRIDDVTLVSIVFGGGHNELPIA